MPVATGPAATKSSRASGDRRCNAIVLTTADAQWNVFWSVSGAGSGRAPAESRRQLILAY